MSIIHVTKAFKYEIFPTNEQKVLLNKTFGCCRFIYNHTIARYKEEYDKVKDSTVKPKFNELFSTITKELSPLSKNKDYSFLREVHTACWHNSAHNLKEAFDKWFKKLSKFPKFKKKNDRQSCTIFRGTRLNSNFELKGRTLRLPKKLGELIKVGKGKQLSGIPKQLILSKSPTGRYYASIMCINVDLEQFPKTSIEVGIDIGIKDFAILTNSKGNSKKYDNPKNLFRYLKKIKFLNRQLSRKDELYKKECIKLKKLQGKSYIKPERSKCRNKLRLKLAKVHEKVSNKRETYLHQVSTDIVKNHDVICLETLKVKNMIKNKNLSKHLADVSFGAFIRYIEYKAGWHNRTVSKINTFFPSSKLCNKCHYKNDLLTLNDREWTCPNCGEVHDRDINASINILSEGKRILEIPSDGSVAVTDVKPKRKERSVPVKTKDKTKVLTKKRREKSVQNTEKNCEN